MHALTVMVPGFEQYLRDAPQQYAVFNGRENLAVEQLGHPSGQADIRIAPVPSGSKRAGLFQVIVGVVLIVAGFFTGGTTWGPAMMVMGAGMALSGAMLMLSPQTTGTSSEDGTNNRASYAFNGAVNTVAQGNPVPILYGELIVGSCVISGGIFTEERS
jgi:predicted phage tail protein